MSLLVVDGVRKRETRHGKSLEEVTQKKRRDEAANKLVTRSFDSDHSLFRVIMWINLICFPNAKNSSIHTPIYVYQEYNR